MAPQPPEAWETTRTALTVAMIPAGTTATVSPARTDPASTLPPTAHGPKKRSPAPTSSDAGNRSGIGRPRSGSGIASIAATKHALRASVSGYHDRNEAIAASRASAFQTCESVTQNATVAPTRLAATNAGRKCGEVRATFSPTMHAMRGSRDFRLAAGSFCFALQPRSAAAICLDKSRTSAYEWR